MWYNNDLPPRLLVHHRIDLVSEQIGISLIQHNINNSGPKKQAIQRNIWFHWSSTHPKHCCQCWAQLPKRMYGKQFREIAKSDPLCDHLNRFHAGLYVQTHIFAVLLHLFMVELPSSTEEMRSENSGGPLHNIHHSGHTWGHSRYWGVYKMTSLPQKPLNRR